MITVYQAFSPEIAEPALAAGTFVPPFQVERRTTWIKPSFLSMMHRSRWGMEPGRERVLAIDVTREGFEWALAHSVLNGFDPGIYPSSEEWARLKRERPVRVQWVAERSLALAPVPYRSIQVGLSGEALRTYVNEWVTGITDVTETAHRIRDLVASGDRAAASDLVPAERRYDLPEEIRRQIGMTA